MTNTFARRAMVLLAGCGAALSLAACDSAGSITQPDAGPKAFQPAAHHDEAACRSGYMDSTGRWVCA